MATQDYSTTQEQENLLARLDRLPVNRRILFLVFLLGLVWILEAFDIGIIAPVLFIIRGLWHLQPASVGLVGSAGTLGIVLGLLPAGRIADRFGRKTTLLAGIIIFSVFTFAASFSRNASEIVICRFLAGLGQGAVFPVPYLWLEHAGRCPRDWSSAARRRLARAPHAWGHPNFAGACDYQVPSRVAALPAEGGQDRSRTQICGGA
jgi:hypothetical protein